MFFGWGLSALMTFLAFAADKNDFVPEELKLKLGKDTCFMTSMHFLLDAFFSISLEKDHQIIENPRKFNQMV